VAVKVGIIGDLHLGKTIRGYDRTDDVVRTWETALKHMQKRGVTVLVQTGDVYDTSTPSPELTALGIRLFSAAAQTFNLVAVLVGNHDLRHGKDKSDALAPLREVAPHNLLVATAPFTTFIGTGKDGLLLLPYESRSRRAWHDPEEYDKIINVHVSAHRPGRILAVGHLDLPGARLGSEAEARGGGHPWPPCSWARPGDVMVDGHYHRPQDVPHGPWTVRCVGTPVPLDFGEKGEVKRWLEVDL
jgi:exonuclease SbcD